MQRVSNHEAGLTLPTPCPALPQKKQTLASPRRYTASFGSSRGKKKAAEMADNRTATVTYTEEIVRDAVRTYVWQRGIVSQKGLWIVEAAMIIFVLWLLWHGERGWLIGIAGLVVILPPLLIAIMWAAHHHNTIGKFRRMSAPQADFAFLDEGLEITSELGAAKIPWSTVMEIWERPDYWMIFVAPNQFMTMPLRTVSATDRDFLRRKASSAVSRTF